MPRPTGDNAKKKGGDGYSKKIGGETDYPHENKIITTRMKTLKSREMTGVETGQNQGQSAMSLTHSLDGAPSF